MPELHLIVTKDPRITVDTGDALFEYDMVISSPVARQLAVQLSQWGIHRRFFVAIKDQPEAIIASGCQDSCIN